MCIRDSHGGHHGKKHGHGHGNHGGHHGKKHGHHGGGGHHGSQSLSLQMILGYLFAPIAWLMGVPWDEAIVSGKLLGIKTALNEFVAYAELANLQDGILSDRSKLITLYGLCGFANFSSVGILVSGIGAMSPERKPDLIKVSLRALIGATLASCMTGTVIAVFI